MSLLADLLSKIKQPQLKREVPPNLKNIVQKSAVQSAYKKKMLILSILLVASVSAGIFIVYFVKSLTETSDNSIAVSVPDMVAKVNERMDESAEVGKLGSSEVQKDKSIAEARLPYAKNEKTSVPSQPLNIKDETENESSTRKSDIDKVAKTKEHKSPSESPHLSKKERENSPFPKKAEIIEPQTTKKLKSPPVQDKKINISDRDAYLYSAREYEMKKDYSRALAKYKKALEVDKNNFTVLNNIAYIYLQLGLDKESVRYSQMALSINKDYAPALINLGIANAKSENIFDAENYLNQAINLEPDNQFVLLNLAILYERQKNYTQASEYYTQLIKLGNVEGSLGQARIYERQDKTEEALKLYRSVYALDSVDHKTRTLARQRIIILLNAKRLMETEN